MKHTEQFRFAQRVNERGASTSTAGVRSDYSVPSGVGVRADHAVLRPATNRAAVLLIETDSKSLIGPKG